MRVSESIRLQPEESLNKDRRDADGVMLTFSRHRIRHRLPTAAGCQVCCGLKDAADRVSRPSDFHNVSIENDL